MILSFNNLQNALSGLLNNPDRVSALRCLAYIKYPTREIIVRHETETTCIVTLYFWGFEYKHRTKKKSPAYIDEAGMMSAFNAVLLPQFYVYHIDVYHSHVDVCIQIRRDSF